MKQKGGKKNIAPCKLTRLAEFLKIAADENRLKILCLLGAGDRCVCEIWKILDRPQNLISHHLKTLKNAGLVADRKQGLKVYYSLNQTAVKKHLRLFNNLFSPYE